MVAEQLSAKFLCYVQTYPEDLISLLWFLFCCIGYNFIIDNFVNSSSSLSARMHLYRIQWMNIALSRQNRVVDANIINGLHNNVAFFASTSLLIIAGLLATIGYTDQVIQVLKDVPFAGDITSTLWYTKLGVMISLFIYAFFKFTWALRQLNYSVVLVGAMPLIKHNMDEYIPAASRAAMVLTMGAKDMNRGLRIYSFAIACIGWFINYWVFMLATALIAWVIYRREFKSHIVKILNMPSQDKLLLSDIIAQDELIKQNDLQ